MSETDQSVLRWEGPSFGQSLIVEKKVSLASLEAEAKKRGFEAGKLEGLKAGSAEVKKNIDRMKNLVDEMANPFRGLDQLVVKELAELAVLLSKQIVRRELLLDSGVIQEIASEAISTLSSLKGDIEVYIHPNDVLMVEAVAEKKLEGNNWKLIQDSTLSPGGCRIKTAESFIDASVEKQMEWVFGAAIESCEDKLDD